MPLTRKYHFKDVEMLLGGKTVVENLNTHLVELSVERPIWTTEFVAALSARIDTAISDFLGLDPKKDLRAASRAIHEIQTPALKDIAFFKTQIEADFIQNKPHKNEILTTLGFTDHLKDVQTKNQEALIQLLYIFKKNMDTDLKTEITDKGMSASLINRIISYADTLKAAGVTQETFKLSTKQITESAVKEFNEIYTQIESVCKIASKFYRDNKIVKEKFTFSKIIDNMTATKSGNSNNDTTDTNINNNTPPSQ